MFMLALSAGVWHSQGCVQLLLRGLIELQELEHIQDGILLIPLQLLLWKRAICARYISLVLLELGDVSLTVRDLYPHILRSQCP